MNSNTNIPLPQDVVPKKDNTSKNSKLSVLALVFSILGCTFFVGIILAIIDLTKKDGRKKTLSIIALVIAGIWLLSAFVGGDKKENETTTTTVETEVEETDNIDKETEEKVDDIIENLEQITEEPKEEISEAEIVEEKPTISKEDFIASCQEMPYKTLARNPEEYIGTPIVLTVKISQILQGGFFDDNQYYRVYTNDEYDLWLGNEYFMYDSRVDDDMKLLQDDVIKVYGNFLGTETVTRALTDTEEEVPSFEALYIELISE